MASEYLERKGYRILERNFRCREGEIDIIAQQGECLVFVEVRTRRGSDYGMPEESLTSTKRERLVALADAYLQTSDNLTASWRIDVVAIELAVDNKVRRVEHIENAVN